MSKRELQKAVNEIPALAGYQVEKAGHSYYLRNPRNFQASIYLQNGAIASRWIANYQLTGRDNQAMRRMR